jgi:sugar lactone lactonase YvrE
MKNLMCAAERNRVEELYRPVCRTSASHETQHLRYHRWIFFALTWLALSAAGAQTTNYTLGATAVWEAPYSGSDSIVLAVAPPFTTWTATSDVPWLHLSVGNQSGAGSTNVVFSFDANPGATRSGTLTIAGQTLTVTQAGSTYVMANPLTALVSSNLNYPQGIAVDAAGNVYIADTQNNAIKKWTAGSNAVSMLVSTGLGGPQALAVDVAGNVYIADTQNNAIKKWTAATASLSTLVSAGLNRPQGVALDAAGNVYIADTGNSTIKKWNAVGSNVVTLVTSGLSFPEGVAVDAAGNVYIADSGNNAIKEWNAGTSSVTTLVSASGFLSGVAVDGAGNVYIADLDSLTVSKWTAAANTLTTLVASGLFGPCGLAVDGTGNVYVADAEANAIQELPYAFVDATTRSETGGAGSDVLPAVLPPSQNVLAPFAPSSDQTWLTITGITNGAVGFSFNDNNGPSRTAHITVLGQSVAITQSRYSIYSLGTTNVLEGPTGGSNSVVLAVSPNFGAWTATANAPWLHLSEATQSGVGPTNVIFGRDANPGATRTGTLTIAGQTVTVTQAGSSYVPASVPAVLISAGLNAPKGVAVDSTGNVYIADTGNNAIKEWVAASNSLIVPVATGLNAPQGVAVDGVGSVYIADTGNNALKKWTPANNAVTTLVASGLSVPTGVAVDGMGNVFIANNAYGSAVNEWTVANGSLTTLVSVSYPSGVAVDVAGNVYVVANYYGLGQVTELRPDSSVTVLVTSWCSPFGVAVDGAGNVYIGESGYNAIGVWNAVANDTNALVSSGLSGPCGVAVDGAGNVYFADTGNNAIKELPHAFLDATPKIEGPLAGNDSLPAVLPATAGLFALFPPTSDQPWLTVSGVTNGIVSFSFTATTSNRTAHISLLGQSIPIHQGTGSNTYTISTSSLVVGPSAGTNAVMLTVDPSFGAWTNTPNASWLHLTPANQNGLGSTNVSFCFDANPGATRSGTVTIGDQTLTVMQAGSTYVPAGGGLPGVFVDLTSKAESNVGGTDTLPVVLPPSIDLTGTNAPASDQPWLTIADATNGVVCFSFSANTGPARVAHIFLLGQTITVVQGSNSSLGKTQFLEGPAAGRDSVVLAVMPLTAAWTATADVPWLHLSVNNQSGAGSTNVIFSFDANPGATRSGTLTIAGQSLTVTQAGSTYVMANPLTALVSSNLSYPQGIAVDAVGNVYIADAQNNAIKKWTAASSAVSTLVSTGLSGPQALAVDVAGNVYIADTQNNAIKKWTAATASLSTLVSAGLNRPQGVALDTAGNVYIADTGDQVIKEWSLANNTVNVLVSTAPFSPNA